MQSGGPVRRPYNFLRVPARGALRLVSSHRLRFCEVPVDAFGSLTQWFTLKRPASSERLPRRVRYRAFAHYRIQ